MMSVEYYRVVFHRIPAVPKLAHFHCHSQRKCQRALPHGFIRGCDDERGAARQSHGRVLWGEHSIRNHRHFLFIYSRHPAASTWATQLRGGKRGRGLINGRGDDWKTCWADDGVGLPW